MTSKYVINDIVCRNNSLDIGRVSSITEKSIFVEFNHMGSQIACSENELRFASPEEIDAYLNFSPFELPLTLTSDNNNSLEYKLSDKLKTTKLYSDLLTANQKKSYNKPLSVYNRKLKTKKR